MDLRSALKGIQVRACLNVLFALFYYVDHIDVTHVMSAATPHLKTSFTYRGTFIRVNWFDLVGQELPDLSWQQVYIIGDLDGKVPIVHYATGDKDNLPGGKVEPGETVHQAILREMREELNCEVIAWYPIGYQENHEPNGKVVYQLRVHAKLKLIGAFFSDPGGSVVGYSLVPLRELNDHISYGDIGERMMRLAQGSERQAA